MAFYGILWLMRCVIIHLKLRRHRFRTWFNSSNFCRRCRSAPGSGRRLPSGPFNMPMVPPVYLSPKKRAQVWHPNDIQMTSKWHPMTSMTLSLYGSLWRKWSKLVNCRCLDNVLSTCAIQASYSSHSTCQKALYGLVTCISATKSIVLAARFQNQDFASRTP